MASQGKSKLGGCRKDEAGPNLLPLLLHMGEKQSDGCCGADSARCLASVPAQGDAQGTPLQPVTELYCTRSCQWLIIISANTISSFVAAFSG